MRSCSDTDIDLYLITKGHRVKLVLRISSSPDPTSKRAHINLGHFQDEERNTNASHSTRNKLDNKKKKKDFELKYERLCRGETRKVGINFFFYTMFD